MMCCMAVREDRKASRQDASEPAGMWLAAEKEEILYGRNKCGLRAGKA